MLLVHNDDAEAFQWGKNRAAGADHDVSPVFVDLVPFVVAFAVTQMAVKDGDAIAAIGEAGLEAFDGLRSQRDFRHQDESGAATLQHTSDGLEIDFGLAAAGDAVQQDGFGLLGGVDGCGDAGVGSLLFIRECQRLAGKEGLVVERIAFHADFAAGDPARFDQGGENGGGAGHVLADLAEGRLAFATAQDVEHARLHRCLVPQLFEFVRRRFAQEFEMAVRHETARFVPYRLREHGAQHGVNGDEVVFSDPACEFEQSGGKHGPLGDDGRDLLEPAAMRGLLQQLKHHGIHPPVLQGDHDARAHNDLP